MESSSERKTAAKSTGKESEASVDHTRLSHPSQQEETGKNCTKQQNEDDLNMRRPRILLGITGSVAAVKGPEIAVRLAREVCADVQILLTRGGGNFWNKAKEYDPVSWERFTELWQDTAKIGTNICDQGVEKGECKDCDQNTDHKHQQKKGCDVTSEKARCVSKILVHTADDEWKDWNRLGDPVLHIDLRNWADVILIAPLAAHTLAKLATGLCDDTLSCCVRAWDFGHGSRLGKPLILCPAMNTAMWVHPLTRSQLDTVCGFSNSTRKRGGKSSQVYVVEPQEKMLACGEVGTGALAEVSEIIRVTKVCLEGFYEAA